MTAPETFDSFKPILDQGAPSRHDRYFGEGVV